MVQTTAIPVIFGKVYADKTKKIQYLKFIPPLLMYIIFK